MKEEPSWLLNKYLVFVLLINVYFLWYLSKWKFFGKQIPSPSPPLSTQRVVIGGITMDIPFYYVPSWTCEDGNPPIQDLFRSFHKYKDDCATAIASVTTSHEIAKKTEWFVFSQNEQPHNSHPLLSNIMEQRLTVIAELLELDGFVLEHLLKPIQFTLGIAEHEHHSVGCCITKDNVKSDVSSYDSAMHIITHITRDWTTLGTSIRISLYNWCIEKISMYRNQGDRILVPGAGLGRLTWDLFRHGYNVEAN
jgi:hypothetical protein